MGGNHKKNLRAEKAKVKLKGAKLPKGLNVTKTDFKVKKITIREQLKDAQIIDGQRLISIKEILSKLKHHSSNFRMEALRNLRENINGGDGRILFNLNELTQGIAAICLDVDRETRRESFKVLSSFLSALPLETITPFFHVISSYLRCAMTHIQPSIQEDSLLMLDVLLKHVSNLVAANSMKIFQNFLEMISKVRAEGDKAGRVLTVNMGNQQTTIKWRSKILQRLQQMLQTLAEHNRQRSLGGSNSNTFAQLTHSFSIKEPQYFNLLRRYESEGICDLSSILCKSVGDSGTVFAGDNSTGGDKLILQRYIEHLMPLLFDAWLEVRPRVNTTASSDDHVMLSYDAAYTLKVVLDIIETLWALVDIHENYENNNDLSSWFRSVYAKDFATHFQEGTYPYQQSEKSVKEAKPNGGGRKNSKKALPDAGGPYCLQQNVNIAYLMSLFFSNNIAEQSKNFKRILKFLTTVVGNLKLHRIEDFTYLEKALRALLYLNGREILKYNSVELQQLLNTTINAFLENSFPSNAAAKVLVLLCHIVQDTQLFNDYGPEGFTPFLVYLPQLLLRATITEQALLSMSNLGKQQNLAFLNSLQQVMKEVIENTQKIQVIGACNAFEGKKHIMNIFYWLECKIIKENEAELLQQINNCVTDKRIVSYYNFVISKN